MFFRPLPANSAARLEEHDIAVAVPRHQLFDIEVMPPVAAPAMCGQAVVGFGEVFQCTEGYRLHTGSITDA